MTLKSQDLPSLLEEEIRSLGGGGGDAIELDYTVFATAVLTMGLLLIVEVIRHKIDRIAEGHDFFMTVLKTVYHECK